jgi:hypothetical protein
MEQDKDYSEEEINKMVSDLILSLEYCEVKFFLNNGEKMFKNFLSDKVEDVYGIKSKENPDEIDYNNIITTSLYYNLKY